MSKTAQRLLWLTPLLIVPPFLWLVMLAYPMVGHDLAVFFPLLIEGKWHVIHQGFTPLRYAVHLCGGLPVYASPNDVFYSVAQLTALFTDPLTAVLTGFVVPMLIGYGGWYLLGRDVMRLERTWAHLLAAVIVTNGFHVMHAAAGHLNFAGMPMIGLLLWLLLDVKRTARWSRLRRVCLFSLTAGALLYGAGYFTLMFAAMTFALLVPALYLWRDGLDLPQWKTLAARTFDCTALALLLCTSKLIAVYELMRVIPRRDHFTTLHTVHATLGYMMKALWAMPQDVPLYEGVQWAIHEQSMFQSPAVPLGLLCGALLLARSRAALRKRRLFLVYVIAFVTLATLVVGGLGPVTEWFSRMPVLKSMRVSLRFLYVFSLPAAVAGVAFLAAASRDMRPRAGTVAGVALIALTVIAMPVVNLRAASAVWHAMPYDSYLQMFRRVDETDGLHAPVSRIVPAYTDFSGTSGMLCNDALFIWARFPNTKFLNAGPVSEVRDGHFNLINPACYTASAENECSGTILIRESDAGNFERFRRGQRTTWKLTASQRTADAVSLIMLAGLGGGLLLSLLHSARAFALRRHTGPQRGSVPGQRGQGVPDRTPRKRRGARDRTDR